MPIDTLNQHINNIFSVLPQTSEIKLLKKEVKNELFSLQQELVDKGYSPNQANALLLAKYGNIDDVLESKGVHLDMLCSSIPTYTLNDALDYIAQRKRAAMLFCIGLSFIIFAFPCSYITKALFSFTPASNLDINTPSIHALIILLCFVSLGLFIITHSHTPLKSSPLTHQHTFILSSSSYEQLKADYATYSINFSIIVGLMLCLIAPLTLLNLPPDNIFMRCCHFFVFCLLLSCACSIFIMCMTLHFTYQKLLNSNTHHCI